MKSEINHFKVNPADSHMGLYGTQRLNLGVYLRDYVLPKLSLKWVIESGTLLGAWRNGRFIHHDDDFDIILLVDSNYSLEFAESVLDAIKLLLPPRYQARLVTSYTEKIEIFEPAYGKYLLQHPQYCGGDFHHVTADLQFFIRRGEKYVSTYFPHKQGKSDIVSVENMYPIGSICLEGEWFPAPFNTEEVLKELYGSLEPNAKFNPQTGYYESRD